MGNAIRNPRVEAGQWWMNEDKEDCYIIEVKDGVVCYWNTERERASWRAKGFMFYWKHTYVDEREMEDVEEPEGARQHRLYLEEKRGKHRNKIKQGSSTTPNNGDSLLLPSAP